MQKVNSNDEDILASARLQGFPDAFVIPVSDNQAYKQFGNSVVVPLIEVVAKQIISTIRNFI